MLGVSSGASLGVALTVVSVGSAGAAGGLFTGGLGVAGRVGTVAASAAGAGPVLGLVLLLSRWVRSAVTLLRSRRLAAGAVL